MAHVRWLGDIIIQASLNSQSKLILCVNQHNRQDRRIKENSTTFLCDGKQCFWILHLHHFKIHIIVDIIKEGSLTANKTLLPCAVMKQEYDPLVSILSCQLSPSQSFPQRRCLHFRYQLQNMLG